MKSLPRSPTELSEILATIFPSLPREFASSGESVLEHAGPTYHSVLREFAYLLARDLDQFPDRQLRRFADLVVRSVATPGPLENAFNTCLLEHAPQLGIESRLRPFLEAAGKGGNR
jgi:hypothetical protein